MSTHRGCFLHTSAMVKLSAGPPRLYQRLSFTLFSKGVFIRFLIKILSCEKLGNEKVVSENQPGLHCQLACVVSD